MNITPEMLKQIPELYYSAGLAVSLQLAQVQATEQGTTVTIDFATEYDRNVFLEGVRFAQSHKSAEAK